MTECLIEWNKLSLTEWDSLFQQVRRSTLLQSYPYAQAAGACYRQRARWGLIRIAGVPAGLVQMLEAGLFGPCLHAVMVDRGPLWLPGYGAPEHHVAFWTRFDKDFPRRWGRRRRIIPEIEQPFAMLMPFAAVSHVKPYQTLWLDLSGAETDLRQGLDKKWRNALSKSERSGLRLEWSDSEEALSWLLLHHEVHRAEKKFYAASPRFVRLLARYCRPRGEMLVGRVFCGDDPVAGVLFFRHGQSATYQLGWSGEAGRQYNAHHLLLWQGALTLKERGVRDLDLGGINEEAEGVRLFKQGMGGESVILSGLYT